MDLNLEIPISRSGSPSYKRVLDIIGAAVRLIICLPISIFIAILIKLELPGSVIYHQERIGKSGKTFVMYKFRAMCEDNPELERETLSSTPDCRQILSDFKN
jgi:lipopolysaccharide/colanic/teichoic acid biosynthesis glycosyltransferase